LYKLLKTQIQRLSQAVKSIFTRSPDALLSRKLSEANKIAETIDTDTVIKEKSKPTAKRSTSGKKRKKRG
tara:strand:- start:1285 stop:1494 length:210 start_codon:yes stop_codon:yes gene_type:complete